MESTTEEPAPAPEDSPTWWWWLLAAVGVAAVTGVVVAMVRGRRKRAWRAELGEAEADVAWFARELLPELRRAGTLDRVVGGWQVGSARVAAAEDELTVLEASAPGDADRSRARALRDAVRLARRRLDVLGSPGPHDEWALDLDEVAADVEAALGQAAVSGGNPPS